MEVKSHINKRSKWVILTSWLSPKFPWKRENKNKEKREIVTVVSKQLHSCVSFSLLFSWAKLFYNVCLRLIIKLTMRHILSFSLTPRATAHNNNNVLTFAILKYESPFSSNLTFKICNWRYWILHSLLLTWATLLVVQVKFSLFPKLATPLRWCWRCLWGFIFGFEGHCISFKKKKH